MSSSHIFLFLYCMAFDVLPYSYSEFLSIITQFSLDTAKPEFPLIYFMIKLSLQTKMFFFKKVMTLCQFAGTRTHLLLRVSVGMLHSQFVVTVTIAIIRSTLNFTFLRNKFADVQHPKDLVCKFDDFLVP